MKKLLIVIDYQKDFVDGSLGFKEAQDLDDYITSLSHISKIPGDQAAYGRRRYRSGWCNADPAAFRPVRLRADLWAVCLNG